MANEMKLAFWIGAGLLILILEVVNGAEDYCDPHLCDPGVKHIGCDNPNQLDPSCEEGFVYEMNDKLKKLIVDTHNDYRNQVAKGTINWLQSSSNMVAMDWDDDLAYLAELNVKTCSGDHDKCHNTVDYPSSGQNIASWGTSGSEIDVDKKLPDLIWQWWDERHKSNQRQINKLFDKKNTLHFTMLARDKANRVGCGLIRNKQNGWYWLTLTCNYAYTNMIGTRVYKSGTPCSECKTGCDKKWDGLCTKDEPVDL
ncbi:antigen 5 like allergen Cul n 1-like [Uranotaenia lowii]|uniref:antigen 5 like allergen Cul n 1-like n=1 Tax=Uranotaenia lowii TaxID=190385 RepID=UPI00247A9471|nr:antigen 5 like allergen Cul n 1-like [Uranotaenia lowii]